MSKNSKLTPITGTSIVEDLDSDMDIGEVKIEVISDTEEDSSIPIQLFRIQDAGDDIFDTGEELNGTLEDCDPQGATPSPDGRADADTPHISYNLPSQDMSGMPNGPLYTLDPKDFLHDPQKIRQIMQAIKRKDNREKKQAHLTLLEETVQHLREHNAELKATILELASCGCPRNGNANLNVLDVNIPIVPPRTCKKKGPDNHQSLTTNSDQSILQTNFNGSMSPPPRLFPGPGVMSPGQLNALMNSSVFPNGLQNSVAHPPTLMSIPPSSSSVIMEPRGPPPLVPAPGVTVILSTSGQVIGIGPSSPDHSSEEMETVMEEEESQGMFIDLAKYPDVEFEEED